MWIGLIHLQPADAPEHGCDMGVIVVYERERTFTVGGPLKAVPQMLRLLRLAAIETYATELPRCRCCDAPLDVPDIDGRSEAACASA